MLYLINLINSPLSQIHYRNTPNQSSLEETTNMSQTPILDLLNIHWISTCCENITIPAAFMGLDFACLFFPLKKI